MKITAKELNKSYQYTSNYGDNTVSLFKEHGTYFIQGWYNGSFFHFTATRLDQAKKIFIKNKKQIASVPRGTSGVKN